MGGIGEPLYKDDAIHLEYFQTNLGKYLKRLIKHILFILGKTADYDLIIWKEVFKDFPHAIEAPEPDNI